MKKSIIFSGLLIACLCSAAVTVSAKDGKEKKDVKEYLPEAGDFAISVSANPFINFVGNIFNNTANQAIGTFGGDPYNVVDINQPAPAVSIAGKYMLTDELGLRVNLGWIHDANTLNRYVQDDAELENNPLSGKKLTDSYITRESGGSFSAAIEYRVGKRRVQGVFSAGLMYAFSYDRTKYTYGNAITEINQNPATAFPLLSAVDPNSVPDGFSSMRYLSKFSDSPSNYAGLILSAGIEWFVAPKVSIGGEVNISALYNWTKATYYTGEGFNTISNAVETWTELESPSSHGFSFGTGNIGSNLSVTFYF